MLGQHPQRRENLVGKIPEVEGHDHPDPGVQCGSQNMAVIGIRQLERRG